MKIICGVAARSGGHIIPCLTKIKQECSDTTEVLFFSSHKKIDTAISQQFPWISQQVILTLDNIPYNKPWLFPRFIWQFTKSFFKSFYIFIRKRPEKIISTGGYLSLPVCFAARCAFIPVELFELNVQPGRASRVIAPFAKKFSICFKDTQNHIRRSCTLEPYPLRFPSDLADLKHKANALKQLNYDPSKTTLFILGGSQGSIFLNSLICNVIQQLDHSTIQIIHQAGENELELLNLFYKQMHIPARVFAYEQNLIPYYQAADIVICRAGAGTLFETAFFNKQCITIPLEIAGNTHQIDNAYAIHTMYPDLFTVLEQKHLTEDSTKLVTQLLYQLKKPKLKAE